MKAVALHTLETARKRQHSSDRGHVAVKSSVEARDLENARVALATELQHLDLGGEMFGCIIHDAPKFVEEFIIDNTMGAISGPAMDDAMANGDERDILQFRASRTGGRVLSHGLRP